MTLIDKLEALLTAATKGSWQVANAGVYKPEDEQLIVASVNALPALLRVVRAAEAWRERTRGMTTLNAAERELAAALDALDALDKEAT